MLASDFAARRCHTVCEPLTGAGDAACTSLGFVGVGGFCKLADAYGVDGVVSESLGFVNKGKLSGVAGAVSGGVYCELVGAVVLDDGAWAAIAFAERGVAGSPPRGFAGSPRVALPSLPVSLAGTRGRDCCFTVSTGSSVFGGSSACGLPV